MKNSELSTVIYKSIHCRSCISIILWHILKSVTNSQKTLNNLRIFFKTYFRAIEKYSDIIFSDVIIGYLLLILEHTLYKYL